MIRFRNPISDMNILIENFRKMYIDFSNMEYFNLDNIAEFFAREKLASSSGYIGDEALRRSYLIKDDSRKSMKMQAKSYSELFRFLGWITSGDKALIFNFTYLGVHVALSGEGAKSLFEQCLLGITYPNHILNVKFPDINKPFINMLRFADRLDGKIHRDEILLGPMDLLNGYDENEINKKVSLIQDLRNTRKLNSLNQAIVTLANKNAMKPNSVRNLTRFVISSLEFSGWFEKQSLSLYGSSSPFLVLTEKGRTLVNAINKSINLNGDDLKVDSDDTKIKSEISLLHMFKRAGFDVDSDLDLLKPELDKIKQSSGLEEIFFSPYQYFSKEELDIIFPDNALDFGNELRHLELNSNTNLHSFKKEFSIEAKESSISKDSKITKNLLTRLSKNNSNLEKAIEEFILEIKTMKQSDFYPLVANLLGYIFNREAFPPPAGNNNMRYDVIIPDDQFSIPVEVKSPTEEEMLSVKAIRQALENKVLLLSRKPYPTTFEISSFACGFNLPNNRSDVYKVIEEIHTAYKVNIAIMDMKILISAAFYCATSGNFYDVSEFKNKRGIVNFESKNL